MNTDYALEPTSRYTPDLAKDPEDTSDVVFNWAERLEGDTIATSAFLLPDGLTQVSISNTTTTATIFVSGGVDGSTYRITNRVTTAGGRQWDKTLYVAVRDDQ